MYSPPVGGAARRLSATIDKQNTSNRRFIIYGEEDYLCGNDLWQMVGRDSPSAPDLCRRRADAPSRRNEQANGPGAGRLQVILTILDPLLRTRGRPKFAASGSARTYRRQRALLPAAGANY